MLRCTRVWFPSKHDFFFQASFTKITAELRESVLHLFFFVTSEKIYSEDDNTIHTWNNWNIPSILFFFPISMSCNAWDWKIHMVSQLNVGFFWNPYSLVTNFFVIYLLVGENPSHLSPAKAVSNSLKFLSYDRLKCIPILCGSYLRCIIDE